MINFELWWYFAAYGIFILGRWLFKKKLRLDANLMWELLFITYLLGLVQVTIFPIRLPDPLLASPEFQTRPNWIPFATIYRYFFETKFLEVAAKNVGGNAILLLPLGFLLPLRYQKMRSFTRIFLLGVLIAAGIELVQLVISLSMNYYYRSIDVDDVTLNTVGALIGYGAFRLFKHFTQDHKTQSKQDQPHNFS